MEIFRSKHPLVSRRNPSIQQWPLISWTIEDWIQALNDIRFLFRAHSKQDDRTRIQWEKAYIVRFHGTLKGLVKWQQNQTDDREPDKPSLAKSAKLDPEEFDLLDPSLHWVYSSYNHLNVILKEDHLLLKAIDWSLLGLSRTDCEQFDSRRSTIWIGTEGACTPCHFDTYGYNVVVQIKGR